MREKEIREYVIKAHGDQKYGSKPYIYHLDGVVERLKLKGHSELIALGYLHDVIEDTDISYGELRTKFGHEVADSVLLLTHIKDESYFDYIMRIWGSGDEAAMLVKITDLEFNIEESRLKGHLTAYERCRLDKYKLAHRVLIEKYYEG